MIHAADVEGLLEERELVEFAAGLLFAGHETTVTQIDLGMLLLLTNPDQRALLQRDPSLAPRVAEEVLRRAPTSRTGVVVRYAASDVELGGVTIPSGDLLLIGISAANRDDRAFEAPDRFDITRERRAHLGFGYGRHFCVGAPLARVELQCVFGTLFQRFPTLDLAVPFEAIRERTDLLTGGVEELPVTW
jgi:pentalenolactone synthase